MSGRGIFQSSGADYPLQEWDVITKIGDTQVASEGMIKLGANSRIAFSDLVQRLAKNGKLPLTIIRKGQEKQIELPVGPEPNLAVARLNGAYPSYFVFGPLAFTSASLEMLGGLSDSQNQEWSNLLNSNGSSLLYRLYDHPKFDGECVVVSSSFFPHRLSKGFSNPMLNVVRSINGEKIKILDHLVEYLRDSKDEFSILEFDRRINSETFVFPSTEMLKATDDILSDNGIRSQGSPDTLAIWNAAKSK